MRLKFVAIGLWVAFFTAYCCQAQDPCASGGRTDCPEAVRFLAKMQSAVKTNKPEVVAALVQFPLRATIENRARMIPKRDFDRYFTEIFTPTVRCAIEQAKSADLFYNWQGYMIARGTVWWDKKGHGKNTDWSSVPFKIITVNNDIDPSIAKELCPSVKTRR
ncbi:MAG: hypothetical protein ACRD3E_09695 [Terriglobales bacterium]